jgi:hypothetical protein
MDIIRKKNFILDKQLQNLREKGFYKAFLIGNNVSSHE